MKQAIPKNNMFVFTGDTIIVTKRTNCESLDVDTFAIVNCFAQYLEENKLKLNANKTKFIG